MKFLFIIALLFITFYSQAQVREQKVEEINIERLKQESKRGDLNSTHIDRQAIQETQPEDIGILLQKFPGISLKSYGGLGGFKTYSFRSLGAQHTSNSIDGFLLQNAQSGQQNLGQIQASSIERIEFGSLKFSILTPVSALFGGNELALTTFEGNPNFNALKIRFSSKYGSFGQYDGYLALHYSKEKFGITIHGKYRHSIGNYPYSLKILDYTYSGIQKNNQLEEVYSGISIFYRPNLLKKPIRFIYRNTLIDQGLPGATVLYNSYGKQFLKTEQHSFHLDWTDKIKLVTVRYYVTYQIDRQIYTDSFYLNKSNLFKKDYGQSGASAGIRLNKNKFGELINFYGGIESRYSSLSFIENTHFLYQRLQNFASVGLKINEKSYLFDMRFGYQYIYETKNKNHEERASSFPFISLNLQSKEMGILKWEIGGLTSITSRIPSFNEQYYSQTSVTILKPEKVKQITLSNGISRALTKWLFSTKLNLYYNLITDKIVAIPTKNLFIWSIQNIGEVHASGLDFVQVFHFKPNKIWKLNVLANYSFQRSIDRSTVNSPTYGNQISYVPMHTCNFDLSIYRKNTGLSVTSVFVGERYALNQNIQSNLLPNFITFDLSVFQSFKFKKEHKLTIQFQLKNCTNESYAYIRSFVMPGRNYLVSLNYEF